MKIIEYNRDNARKALDKWRDNPNDISNLSADYQMLRTEIVQHYSTAIKVAEGDSRKDYITDVLLGIALYGYLSNQDWFNLRTAANDGFWRYISVAVIPDIVSNRWGRNNDNYFWKQSNRLWPKSIWWYIFLTYNTDLDVTKDMLLGKNFNSDLIQGIVERTGRKGTFVEVYRELIHQYSQLNYYDIVKYKKSRINGNDSLFRALMKLNTARSLVTDPYLCTGGVRGYVQSLFEDINI